MRLETEVGSELPLISFDVTYPGPTAVKVGAFSQMTSHDNIRQTETDQDCLKI